MGYSHYWYRPASVPDDLFRAIRSDFERLILPLSDAGVELASWDGKGVPEVTDERIAFNGPEECGHPENEEITIPYPSKEGQGVGPNTTALVEMEHGLLTRIRHRCCNGCCAYESFHLPRTMDVEDQREPDENGLFIEYVKTAFRPYDVAVTAALLIAKRHLGQQFVVHSNGADTQWADAKLLCQAVLGYGDWFGIIEREVIESLTDSSGAVHTRAAIERELVEIRPDQLLA